MVRRMVWVLAAGLAVCAGAVAGQPRPVPDAGEPIYSDVIPRSADVAYDPRRDTKESFTAPDGRVVDVLVKGPVGEGTYSRAIRAGETPDAYFPAIVQEAVKAGAHHIVVPKATYQFEGPVVCKGYPSAACSGPTVCNVNQYYNCAPHWTIGTYPDAATLTPNSVTDLDIDFSDSVLAFKAPGIGIEILETARLRLRNVTLDWPTLPIASLATIVPDPDNAGHNALVVDDKYPVKDPFAAGAVQIQAVDVWDPTEADPPGRFDASANNDHEVYFIFGNAPQPRYVGRTKAGAQTFSCSSCQFASAANPGCTFFSGCANFDVFAPGTRVIVRHYTYNGFAVTMAWNNDVTFEHVRLLTGPGSGFGSSGGGTRGLRIAHSRIDRAPGRLISVASVAIQLSPQADTIIEDNEIAHQGDDGINPASTVTVITQVAGATVGVAGVCDADLADNPLVGDTAAFFDVDTQYLGSATIRAVAGGCSAPVLKLSQAIEGLTTSGFLVDLTQGADARLIVRNNTVRANRGHGFYGNGYDAWVADNWFVHNSAGGIGLGGGNGQGPGSGNMTFARNVVREPGTNALTGGASSIIAFSGADAPVARPIYEKMELFENIIGPSRGPAIVATSMRDFAIDDTAIVDANQDRSNPGSYGSTSTNDSVVVDASSEGRVCHTERFGPTTGPIGIDPSDRSVKVDCAK